VPAGTDARLRLARAAGAGGGPVIVDIGATIWHRSWCCPTSRPACPDRNQRRIVAPSVSANAAEAWQRLSCLLQCRRSLQCRII